MINLTPEAADALDRWNLLHRGRGGDRTTIVTDPEVIERLEHLRLPHESLNDTIIRLCEGNRPPSLH